MLVLSILIIAAIQHCRGDAQGSTDYREAAMAAAMQGVSQTMQCFGNAMQECLRHDKQNSETHHSLPELEQLDKEETRKHIDEEKVFKRVNEALNKLDQREAVMVDVMREVSQTMQCFGDTMLEGLRQHTPSELHNNSLPDLVEELTESNEAKENQLKEKDKQILGLQEKLEAKTKENEQNALKVLDLQQRLEAKTDESNENILQIRNLQEELEAKTKDNEDNVLEVQDLNNTLSKCQQRVQQLEKQRKELNDTVETLKSVNCSEKCQHPRLEQIKKVVETVSRNDWKALKKGMEAVLDHSSVEYSQLQQAGSVYEVGSKDQTQLASLLLCAGMPVDTADPVYGSMLHGAVYKNHLQLVELLLDHGANVEAKNSYDSTALMMAAEGGYLEVAKRLVEAGADTTPRNKWDTSALEYATKNSHPEVVKYLTPLPH